MELIKSFPKPSQVPTLLLIAFAFIYYLTSLLIVKLDTNFTYRWQALWLHIASIMTVAYIWLYSNRYYLEKYIKILVSKKTELFIFLAVIFLGIVSRFIFLDDYPFISVGDEVRDSGLDAMKIANSDIKDIFTYGSYNAHGRIIPVISSFFYRLFQSSVLTYRLPAAIISFLDVSLFYILIRLVTNSKNSAFFGAFIYLAFPIHLLFGRTQLVVAFNSFWTVILLMVLFILIKHDHYLDYIFMGVILGFISFFHASVRGLSIIILVLLILTVFKDAMQKINREKLRESFYKILLLIAFIFIGFGPLLVRNSPQKFFHTSRYMYTNSPLMKKDFKTLEQNYLKSLMVWFYEPTTFSYPEHKPILSPLISLFFIIGIGYSFFILKNRFYMLLIALTFILPFTHSAISDVINADYRLTPLLPIGAIFTGIGVTWILRRISNKIIKGGTAICLFVYLIVQLFSFFTSLSVNKNRDLGDYLSMHTIYFLKTKLKTDNYPNLSFYVSPANYEKLNLLHYKEQYEYFLPQINIAIEKIQTMGDNEILINNNKIDNYDRFPEQLLVECQLKNYYCPLNYNGNIEIHYQ